MTKDELRSLDAQIAVKLFGWTNVRRLEITGNYIGTAPLIEPPNNSNIVPEFSKDMNAAWEVVEKLKTNLIELRWRDGWEVGFYNPSNKRMEHFSEASEAPYAICLAALKTVEEDKLDSCI